MNVSTALLKIAYAYCADGFYSSLNFIITSSLRKIVLGKVFN